MLHNKETTVVLWFAVVLSLLAIVGCDGPVEETLGRQAFEEIWVNKNTDAADTLFAPDYTGFFVGFGKLEGPEGEVSGLATYQEALPDLEYAIAETAVADGKTAVVWQATGTHRNELFGLSATGEQLEILGVTVYRIEDEQIVQGWHYWHTPGLLFQIGVLAPDVFEEERVDELVDVMREMEPPIHNLVGLEEALAAPARGYTQEELARLENQAEFIGHVCAEAGALNPESTLAFFADDFVEHADFPQRQFADMSEEAALAELFQNVLITFPTELRVEEIFADDDLVVVQSTLDMTQQLEFMGIPPDERTILSQRVDVSRINSEGLIVEHWSGEDLSMYSQLGLVKQETQ